MQRRYTTYLLLSLGVLQGCGRVSKRVLDWDSDTVEYVYLFETQYHTLNTRDLHIHFVSNFGVNSSVIGQCSSGGNILLSQEYWNQANTLERKSLVWHELGHCALGLVHNNISVDGCPVSYMNSYMPTDYCLNRIFSQLGV